MTDDLFSAQEPDEHALFVAYLQDQRTTLWGRSYDVKTKGAPDAATWFLEQRDGFEKWKAQQ